jgi:hypothetical protein
LVLDFVLIRVYPRESVVPKVLVLLVVLDHREDVYARQSRAAIQEREFHGEGCAHYFSA